MLRSVTAKRCRYHARPRGTCLASARHSAANSRLKPSRGNCSTTRLRTASGISSLREPKTSTAAPADDEKGLGPGLEADTGAVMHGDRVGHHLPAVGGHAVAFGELAGQ